jgi:hypothetical protein
MNYPILIIADGASARVVADALRRDFDRPVEVVPTRRAGLAALRRGDYSLLLLEESLASSDAEATEQLYQKALATPVLELNFALSGAPRIARQVRAALTRRAYDQAQAREAAMIELHNELKSSLTGLLLESQLALREAQPGHSAKLRHLVELAGNLCERLQA